jgi:hypothetical protein
MLAQQPAKADFVPFVAPGFNREAATGREEPDRSHARGDYRIRRTNAILIRSQHAVAVGTRLDVLSDRPETAADGRPESQ